MKMTFRWYGDSDPVKIEYIKQIPGMKGVVSAIYDVPAGEVWPLDKLLNLKAKIESAGLEFSVVESIPVHEDIKLGRPNRDLLIDNYCQSVRNMGEAGIPVLCYNFMPVFDWTRSNLARDYGDGSNSLSYDHEELSKFDLTTDFLELPGWASSYTQDQLNSLLEEYKAIDEERLWENLRYFLERVVPVAEESGVRMAIHPDDPPWSIFGLPRIITNSEALRRLISLVDSPSNGVTFCIGSLGPDENHNLIESIKFLGKKDRINFVHMRNVKRTGGKSFYESAHLSDEGSLDFYEIVKALDDAGFQGPVRPDHGRMIWGETGRPGYGLYDRALGSTYINGLCEAVAKAKK
ncbi:MAG: mannonate dehydratase [Spirochaetales bacterium]|nr:mannonate dehydratase [Spirochaetales bacterium]